MPTGCRTRTLDHAQHPTVSIDKQAVRLVKETRESLPATGNHSQRVHCEVRTGGHGGGAHVLRAAERLAAGEGPRASHECGLGARDGGPAGGALCRPPESEAGVRCKPKAVYPKIIL